MLRRLRAAATPAALLVAFLPHVAAAQSAAPATGPDLSGVLYGNFQYHTEPAPTTRDQFMLERAYVTLIAPAGSRALVRVTTDLFRNGSKGYDVRLKYAYLQYQLLHRGETAAIVRGGIVQTVAVEQAEHFWPRWLASSAVDRNGYFSSADVGVSGTLTLPRALGEVYAAVTNGQGYQNAFTDDRFKDYALRVSLTPLARRADAGLLRTLTISPWYYKGDTASVFGPNSARADAVGYLGPLDVGRQRDRYGLLVGIHDPRLTLAASVAGRRSLLEAGQNTAAAPVTVHARTGRLVSVFTVARPFAVPGGSSRYPLAVVLRYDRVTPDVSADGYAHFIVAGLAYDLDDHVSVALDYQESMPEAGLTPTAANRSQIYFAHVQAKF